MWTVKRIGHHVYVEDKNGELVASIGRAEDSRLMQKLDVAEIIARAPEMFSHLIDLTEIVRRQSEVSANPHLDLLLEKVEALIQGRTCKPEFRNQYNRNPKEDS